MKNRKNLFTFLVKNRKKSLTLLIPFLMIPILFTGCKNKDESNLLSKIKDENKIVVGMEGNWQPWSYHDKNSKVIGYDADTAREIAKRLGVKIKIVEAPWEGLFAGLDDKRFDMVINGVEVTKERSKKYDFTSPYAHIHTALVVRKDNNTIKDFTDLKGKETVNSIASTYMTIAESYGAKAKGVSTLDETIQNVIDKRADATLNSEDSIYTYLKEKKDAPIKIVSIQKEASNIAIPIRKGKDTVLFKKEINKILKDMKKDGTLKKLSEKYFSKDVSK